MAKANTKQGTTQITFILIFLILSAVYYYGLLGTTDIDNIFVTLSTFLFALFMGFFISRQSGRYGEIRKLIADFDGNMSSVYRAFGHYGKGPQKKAGEIIKHHYQMIVENGWDYPFLNKTTTLTDLQNLTGETVEKVGTSGVRGAITTRMALALHEAQKLRKNMVALREERIPKFQWMLTYILTAVLGLTVSAIPSSHLLLGSAIKAAFIVSVLVVVVLLKRFDELKLFEGTIGENSAQDVVDIIAGKK
jgi:hypothetical protein